MKLSDIDLIEQLAIIEARESFLAYRQFINPKIKLGWFQIEISKALQKFSELLFAGLKPKLVIQAPPQHGKSRVIVEFITWLAGHNPDLKTIYTSFSERLGIRANLMCQRIYDSERYKKVFPETAINSSNVVTKSGQYQRNREMIEYVGHEGFFRNTTVRGSITGESLDLGVIDDPIKGREEANSLNVRDKTWEWFTDDFFTRFSEDAGLLTILTRWHIDDPVGRMIEMMGDDIKVLSYPAIAEKDEKHRKEGEALFPEHKSLELLLERKKILAEPNWQSLYQQNPIVIGGELFKDGHWRFYKLLPSLRWRAIYVDTAQKTAQKNDYTVFQCWGESFEKKAVLIDQLRGKWEAPELLVQARAFWVKHKGAPREIGVLRAMKVEDKVSGTGLIQTLRREGIPLVAIQRNVDKYTRALDVVPFIESGNVLLPENAPWLSDYLTEFSGFPNATHDDQVDPTLDAITDILQGANINYAELL